MSSTLCEVLTVKYSKQQCPNVCIKLDSQITIVTVFPGPVPALVDAVIVQLYWVAGLNFLTVALRAPLLISFTGSPLPLLGVQTMSYLVITLFCWSGGGGCQENNTISGLSRSYSNMILCGGASGAVEENKVPCFSYVRTPYK